MVESLCAKGVIGMKPSIYFCIKTEDGRLMPVIDYIKQLETSLAKELKK